MKTLAIILSIVGLVSLTSCMQETNPQALMETHESRTEVYKAIAQNDGYMTEFMANLQNDENAVQMMQGNKNMMGSMMKGEGMQMMMKDSMMMKNMMQGMMGNMEGRQSMMDGMMNDGKMMGAMMEMMHEKGMMSEECMESCKKMMAEKGMDMPAGKTGMQGMNKMGNMNSPTKDDHTEHH